MRKFKFTLYVLFIVSVLCLSVFGLTYAWTKTEVNRESELVVSFEDGSLVNIGSEILNREFSRSFSIDYKKSEVCYDIFLNVDVISNGFINSSIKYELINKSSNESVLGVGSFNGVKSGSVIELVRNGKLSNDVSYEFRVWSEDATLSEEDYLSAHLVTRKCK